MKNKKRFFGKSIALLLSAAMLCGMLGACADTDVTESGGTSSDVVSESNSTADETTSETASEESDAIDMGGYEFIFAAHWLFDYVQDEITANEDGEFFPNETTEMYAAKFQEIEDKYNCTIVPKFYNDAATLLDEIKTDIMSGDKPFDIADIPGATDLIKQDMCYAQSDIPTLDVYDTEIFDAFTTKYSTYDGKVYATAYKPDDGVQGIFFNIDALQAAGQPNPYDLYDNDEWNWENFRNMLIATTQERTDGTKQWGISAGEALERGMILANGGMVVKEVSDGEYIFGLTQPEALEALNFVRNLVLEDKVLYVGDPDSRVTFMAGDAVFWPYYSWGATSWFADVEFEYGFLPFPQGPSCDQKVTSLSGGPGRVWVMPRTLDQPDYTGIIYSEIAQLALPAKEQLVNNFMAVGMGEHGMQSFWEMTDARVVDNGFANYWGPFNEAYTLMTQVTRQAELEPASAYAAIEEKMNQACKDSASTFF